METGKVGRMAVRTLRWGASIVVALGIGVAGVTKFTGAARWDTLFLSWGYPPWVMPVVGALEVCGAVMLLVPRTARYGALLLALIMGSALITLLSHPGGPFGWGQTPLAYLVLTAFVAVVAFKERVPAHGA